MSCGRAMLYYLALLAWQEPIAFIIGICYIFLMFIPAFLTQHHDKEPISYLDAEEEV